MTSGYLARSRLASPPSTWLAATELPRAVAEASLFAAALPSLLAFAARGDRHPVLVLPGFLAGDASTTPLRSALQGLGYDVRGWGLGRNIGTRTVGDDGERVIELVEAIRNETGRKPSLVGWSLGGVVARLAALGAADSIRQVITLGSPIGGSPKSSNAWRLYARLSGKPVDDAAARLAMSRIRQASSVPMTAIYTRADGICAWQSCRTRASARSENIEVYGSHCGLGANPAAFHAIADRLAQSEGEWEAFRAHWATSWFFPAAGRA